MKTKCFLTALFFVTVLSAYAQSREDVRIFIMPVTATNPAHAQYFQENFATETAAAGYTVTRNQNEADYSLRLTVTPNMVVYDDGTQRQAPPDEPQYVLSVALLRNSDNNEMLSLTNLFTQVEEMYDYNLYLLYQAMANVPLSKSSGEEGNGAAGRITDDRWRNKWVYARVSLDFPIRIYQILPDGLGEDAFIWRNDPNDPTDDEFNISNSLYSRIDHRFRWMPGLTIGVELQFLNWMSAELNFGLQFGDPISYTSIIPTMGFQLKFPIKPPSITHFMIQPYMMGITQINSSEHSQRHPLFGVGGGLQVSVHSGAGGFFFDANFLYPVFTDVQTTNNDTWFNMPRVLHWKRYYIGLGIGYKIGFYDRAR